VEGARRVVTGLVDQALIAGANAANTILALALLSRERAGAMVLSLGLAYLVLTLNRAFVGDVLVVLTARLDAERRARLLRNGLAAAVTFGAVAVVVLLVIWVFRPRTGNIDLQDLVWVAPFLPVILLHDTGRSGYLAVRAQGSCLVIDLVWVSTQVLVITGFLLAGHRSAGMIFVSWGVGALAGALVFLFRTRQWPWRGDPRRWVSETRHLSGWFTATQIVGQIQVQAISFLVSGRLSQRDLSGLRGGQTALIQPVQNFIMAVQSLIVPRLSRLAGDANRQPEDAGRSAAATMRRQTRLLALALAGLAVVLVLTVVPLSEFVLDRLSKFADIAPLALPLGVQSGIYLVELPFGAALRGMHRAGLLFVRYVIYTTASLAGLVIGGDTDGLHGAVWGLTAGAAVSLATMFAFYRYALRQLVRSVPERPDAEPVASIAPAAGSTAT
jgi:heme/copper-type cytochrome/quinol oxidase subunit 2